MKELSIEQKAKAYDEAFRIAQELYDNPNSSNIGRGYVCAVFPELKESEDERIRNEIILYIGAKNDISLDTHNKWLSWLEKKGEQKPAEWSEEDEKMLSNIVDCIKNLPIFYESININGEDKITEGFICDVINWLKSLKPEKQWKPSDEQMKALHDINLTGNISYAGQGQTLIELYKDLKKLKG